MLGLSSGDLTDPVVAGRVRARLDEVLRAARPTRVYLHDLTDLHPTHVAVARLTLDALRALPAGRRPSRVVACEGWRSLAWLDPARRVALDVTGHEPLARALLACFASQLGAKGYADAAPGRRRANASFGDPHHRDAAREVVFGMDLTPLVADPTLDPAAFVLALIDGFRSGVAGSLGR
jgi:LmbE family N-acetylglucosaminyl deacetylase